MTDLSEPGDLDAWRNPPPPDVDIDAARRRFRRRNAIVDWFQIGFLVIIPILSAVTLLVARHADNRATSARGDTHSLTGDVSALTGSVDRLTRNQEDTARIESQVAAMAEAFRRIALATTPAERQEAIDALNAVPPPRSTTTTTAPASSSTATTTPSSSSSTGSTTRPSPASSPTSTSSTSTTSTTARPLIPPLPPITVPNLPARQASSSRPWPLSMLLVVAALALLFVAPTVVRPRRNPERKPMTQPSTAPAKAAPNPAARVIRTLYMVIVAVAVAIPAATAAFGFTAATSAKLVGLAGGTTVLVTALWNALEGAGVIGTVLAAPAPVTRLAGDDVDLIAQAVHAAAPAPVEAEPGESAPYSFAVELTDDEVEKIANAVAKHAAIAAPAPAAAKKATPAKKAAPRRR